MNVEQFREYCLSIKGSEESISLQVRNILVFKVMGKIFVYIPLEPEDGIFKTYLKCDTERSVELREKYNGVNPDDFKTLMWNWITLDSDVPDELIRELIQHSVDEVIKKLSKKKQKVSHVKIVKRQAIKSLPFYIMLYQLYHLSKVLLYSFHISHN